MIITKYKEIMEFLNGNTTDATCREIFTACKELDNIDDAAKALYYLRNKKKWVEVTDERPKRYRLTDEGRRYFVAGPNDDDGIEVESITPEKITLPEGIGNIYPGSHSINPVPVTDKENLFSVLDDRLEMALPAINEDPARLEMIISTLSDLHDALNRHFPQYQDDLDDIARAISIIKTLLAAKTATIRGHAA